jgi:hypothetical protein
VSRRIAADVLMVIGAWYSASYLSFWLTVALIPINNRLVYEGSIGTLMPATVCLLVGLYKNRARVLRVPFVPS